VRLRVTFVVLNLCNTHNSENILCFTSVCLHINQSIKVICNARNVMHKLESEARAVASGRMLMVIEKVGLEVFFESI